MSGFITLHRRLLDWEWYSDINTKTLFIHCLLKANWEDKNWQGVNVKRGSFITSNQSLSAETKLTIQQIRTSFFKLTKTNEINIQTTNKYTLLTIVKYDDYQNLEIKPTNKQQSNNKQSNNQITTTNNIINKQLNINNILLSEIEISDVREDLKLYFTIAKNFQEIIIKNLQERNVSTSVVEKAKFGKWITPIKLMLENKECSLDDLRDVIRFLRSPKGNFWVANILSTDKLRKQITTLMLKIKQ